MVVCFHSRTMPRNELIWRALQSLYLLMPAVKNRCSCRTHNTQTTMIDLIFSTFEWISIPSIHIFAILHAYYISPNTAISCANFELFLTFCRQCGPKQIRTDAIWRICAEKNVHKLLVNLIHKDVFTHSTGSAFFFSENNFVASSTCAARWMSQLRGWRYWNLTT